MVGIKFSDSSVMIGYQVDEFIHTWLEENFLFDQKFTMVHGYGVNYTLCTAWIRLLGLYLIGPICERN